jgi:Flp pilus assembly protein CpaB
VSPRARAVLFAAGALACGLLSAALAGSAATPAGSGLDELRSVVVSTATLERGAMISRAELNDLLDERRVPAAFAPPDALGLPPEALGRRLAVALPAGSYLTAASLTAGSPASRPRAGPPRGTTPVEITVTGAAALEASRVGPGERVDVVVSGQSGPGPAAGRTYIAAESVPLLSLREARAETGVPGDRFLAVLAVSRPQALRLIRAEGVARSIRLLVG